MIPASELSAALPAHLAAQRWYGEPEGPVSVVALEVLRRPWPALLRAEVVSATGSRWQVLLGLRPAGEWDTADVGDTAAVGTFPAGREKVFAYDALVDPVLALALLGQIAPDLAVATARPIMAEQSNTSLVFDEEWFLKVFRRLHGPNPDAEVPAALAAQGFANVAAPRAVWRVGTDDAAVVQPYLAGASEGWAIALASLRDLFGGDEAQTPAEAGGDFAPEARRLGVLTAGLHRALASAFGTVAGDGAAWAASITARMGAVNHPDLDRARLAAVVEATAGVRDIGAGVRIHGDYHLGQVLCCDQGWYVVDFEGEPAATAAARTERWSPLRDVAGMLRSFHYASRVAAAEHGEDVAAAAAAWEKHNREAFLGTYRKAIAGSGLAPAAPKAFRVVLTGFELDKAVYEVGYEQAHRPDWVAIPLEGVLRLTAAP